MISKVQDKEIKRFFKLIEIREQEVYDEFYDHVVTDYETQVADRPDLDIRHYLQHEFLPSFGGTKGIKKIIKSRNGQTQRFYQKELKNNFLLYFRWPMIVVAISIYLIFHKCFRLFEVKEVFLWGLVVCSGIPILLGIGGYVSYYVQCKVQKKPYVSSIKNNNVLTQLIFVACMAQIPNWLKVIYGREVVIAGGPLVILFMSAGMTMMVILALGLFKINAPAL